MKYRCTYYSGDDMNSTRRWEEENIGDFNLKENLILLHFLKSGNRPSYAAQIERELPDSDIYVGWPEGNEPAKISRRWAKTVCERLVEAGVMKSLLGKTRRQKNLSKHYLLKSDLESFKWIFRRVSPFYGGFLISTDYAKKIIEEQLIEDLEKKYGTEFDEETKAHIVVILFLSTKAVELALRELVLPLTKDPRKSEQGKKEANAALLAVFQSAMLTEIVRSGLAWRRSRIDEIEFHVVTTITRGDLKGSISSRLKYKSDLKRNVFSAVRDETSSSPRPEGRNKQRHVK